MPRTCTCRLTSKKSGIGLVSLSYHQRDKVSGFITLAFLCLTKLINKLIVHFKEVGHWLSLSYHQRDKVSGFITSAFVITLYM